MDAPPSISAQAAGEPRKVEIVLARAIGVILAGLTLIANFLFLAVYPLWSIIVITLDVLVIWALTGHGGELRTR